MDRVSTSSRWQERAPEIVQVRQAAKPAAPVAPTAEKWPVDWRMAIWYKLLERRKRDPEFREPYMAVWITDKAGKPVRTLFDGRAQSEMCSATTSCGGAAIVRKPKRSSMRARRDRADGALRPSGGGDAMMRTGARAWAPTRSTSRPAASADATRTARWSS